MGRVLEVPAHVLHGQRQCFVFSQQMYDAGVVEMGGQDLEQTGELHGVLGDVEGDGLVVDFRIAHFLHAVEEGLLLEGDAVVDHGADRRVVLAVLLVEIHSLSPQQRLLAGTKHLDNIHAAPEDLDVFHELFWGVLGVQHR